MISLALTCVLVCFCCCCVNFWIYQWWTYKTHCFLFSKLPDIQCLSSLSIGRTKESTCYDLQLPWVPLKIRASWLLLLLLLLSLLLLLPLIFYLSFLYFHCLSLLFFLNPYSFFFIYSRQIGSLSLINLTIVWHLSLCQYKGHLPWDLQMLLNAVENNFKSVLQSVLMLLSSYHSFAKLLESLEEEYKARTPYLAYLVKAHQGLLATHAHLERLVERVERYI